MLRRATKTAWLVMQELEAEWVPIYKDWRLNEQQFGALVGKNKKEFVQQYGQDKVHSWRRSWDAKKPPMSSDHEHWPGKDKRYRAHGLYEEDIPQSESLYDVSIRSKIFWDTHIIPKIKQGKRILIVSHGNTIRAMLKNIDSISEYDIEKIEIPRASPLLYRFDTHTLKPVSFKDNSFNHGVLSGTLLGGHDDIEKSMYDNYICSSKYYFICLSVFYCDNQ